MSVNLSPSSLDLGENNSTSPLSDENETSDDSERYDCRYIYQNMEFEEAGEVEEGEERSTAPYRCGSWDCYCCGYRMRQNLIEEIQRITSERPQLCRMLTLTLDPEKAPESQGRRHKYITERWNALRTRLKREVGDFSYIWVREEQENGLPHLHILVSRFLPQGTVSAAWSDLGGGEIVDIRKMDHVDKAAHYVGKYLTKDAMTGLPDGIRRYGSSADLDFNVRQSGDSDGDWRLRKDDYLKYSPEKGAHLDLENPNRREVCGWDFWIQKVEWQGPVPDLPPT